MRRFFFLNVTLLFQASPLDRVEVLEKAARIFEADVNLLRLYTQNYENSLKRDPLMAGPGNSKVITVPGFMNLI